MSAEMIDALRCLVTCMGGIFTVTFVIILCIKLLNALTSDKTENDKP
jgi:hypothetical protein